MTNMIVRISMLLGVSFLVSGCLDSDPNLNTAPEAISTQITTTADTPIAGQLLAADSEEGMLTYALVDEPSQGSVSVNSDGSFTYVPNAEYVGNDEFMFRVSDGQFSSRGKVSIAVELLPVSFRASVRDAIGQSFDAQPLAVNGRDYQQDVTTTAEFDDLVAAGEVAGND